MESLPENDPDGNFKYAVTLYDFTSTVVEANRMNLKSGDLVFFDESKLCRVIARGTWRDCQLIG